MKRVINLTVAAIIMFVIAASIGLVVFARMQAQVLVYPASVGPLYTPADFGLTNTEAVIATTTDGIAIAGWYAPPAESPGGAVILTHGIGAARDQMLPEARLLQDNGYGFLTIDLRNHGDSGGEVNSMGVLEVQDVQAAVDFLLEQPEIDPERIMIIGNSFGASTALLAAAQIPTLKGVVAISPYSSFLGVVGDRAQVSYRLPPRPAADLVLFWGGLEAKVSLYDADPAAAIGQIAPRPVLLIHGKLDGTTPYISSERLYAAAGENADLWLLDDVGHGGFYQMYPAEYETRVLDVIERAIGS